MEEKVKRKNNTLEDLPKMPPEVQLWKDEIESRALNNIEKTEGNRSACGYRVVGDEETEDMVGAKETCLFEDGFDGVASRLSSKHRQRSFYRSSPPPFSLTS